MSSGGERSRTDKRGDEQIREEQHAKADLMPVPCSGIRGGPRKIARPAKCGGPGANNRVSGV